MSFLYADLIGVDIQPVLLAREWTVDRVRQTLEPLAAIAQSIGLGDVWASAAYLGIEFGSDEAEPDGVALGRACFAGVGFSREEDLRRAFPPSVEFVWGRPHMRVSEQQIARLESILVPHFRQFSAVLEVASAAREAHALPVCAAVNIAGDRSYGFDEAYRRRLAYALGFAASLAAGSLAPYKTREPALLHGGLGDLVAVCPSLGDVEGLSIAANLLARLVKVVAGLETGDARGPQPPVRHVPEANRKRQWLEAELRRASDEVREGLNEDGRAALSGLLLEVGRAGTDIRHRYDRYPAWGKLASREEYGLPAEPPHPQDAA